MLTQQIIRSKVREALQEDAPWGDVTVEALIPPDDSRKTTAVLRAREPGVLAGVAVFAEAFRQQDPRIAVTVEKQDGSHFESGDVLATVTGPIAGILTAERVALNFVQRMSGVASLTRKFVDETQGTHAQIVDTRKTTPGLRPFEKYAVLCGGGKNHRYSLSDAVMIKDNHLAATGASHGERLRDAVLKVRRTVGHTTHVEVEVDSLSQIAPVLEGKPDSILLDNFTLDQLRSGVEQIHGRAIVEASGNVNLKTVRSIAHTGVDIISVGALTHGYRSVDLGLDIDTATNSGQTEQ